MKTIIAKLISAFESVETHGIVKGTSCSHELWSSIVTLLSPSEDEQQPRHLLCYDVTADIPSLNVTADQQINM